MTTTHQTTDRRATSAGWPAALLAVALLAIGGCDLFDSGLTYSGVVVDAETGAPLDSIHVSLQTSGGGFGGYVIVEAVLTDRNGAFDLRTPRHDTRLYVNSPGYGGDALYRPGYSSPGPLPRGSGEFRIELQPRPPF